MVSLIETNKPAYQHSESSYNQFNKICAPLLKLGIDYFCYIKILKDGRFLPLFNNLSFIQNWLFTPGGFGDLSITYYEKPEKKSYVLTPYDEASLQKDRTISLLKNYQISSSFNIFKRDGLGNLAGYHFYSTSNDPLFSGFYFENIDILEHFTHYFEERAKNLIDTTDKRKLANFYQNVNIPVSFQEKDLQRNKINQFLYETQIPCIISKSNKEKIKLTKREEQCLYYLSHGNTFKEIGKILGLSPRSIEFYISNLKEKSGYRSREELIVQFNKILTLGQYPYQESPPQMNFAGDYGSN